MAVAIWNLTMILFLIYKISMNIFRKKYKPGDIRERTLFAFFPVIFIDITIWFKFYHVTERYTKIDGTIDEYEWEIIDLQY